MPETHKSALARRVLMRAMQLRCPRCGARSLFRNLLTMHERCDVCQLRFEREPGYFLGAMYINYGVTVVLALMGSFALEWSTPVSLTQQLILWVGFAASFPSSFSAIRAAYGWGLIMVATPLSMRSRRTTRPMSCKPRQLQPAISPWGDTP